VDVAVTIQVLVHITDKLPVFQHVFGSLKPGGVWYIEDFGRKDGTDLDEEEIRLCKMGEQTSFPSKAKFTSLLEEAGFVVESFVDRSVEWSRYVYYRANSQLENEAVLRERGGDRWYE